MPKEQRPKTAKVSTNDGNPPASQKAQAKVTKKGAPERRSKRTQTKKLANPAGAADTDHAPEPRKRGAEETQEAPAKKKGKKTKSTAEHYPAAQLDTSEGEVASVDKVKLAKKGPLNIGAGKKAAASAEAGSMDRPVKKGPSNDRAGQKAVTSIDVEGMDNGSTSEDDPGSDEAEESESDSDEKVGVRKPSKRVLENATNERPIFPANKQPSNKASKGKGTSTVKVKVEKPSGDTSDESDDEDEDAGHGTDRDDATRVAKTIYKKAYKILKLKLYFENFFPTDTEKDSLPYSCWTSAVTSIGGIDGGSAAAQKMFYESGFDKKLDKRISSIRSTFVTKAKDCHTRFYGTDEKISAALKDDRYVYPGDPDTPANPDLVYRNDLIWEILRRVFFDGRDTLPKLFSKELSKRINTDGFIEMPETLVASATTLICGLLRRDMLPNSEKKSWKFSADGHQTTYLKHIRSLENIKNENDVGYSVLLATIYRKASGVTVPSAMAAPALVRMNPAGMSRTYD